MEDLQKIKHQPCIRPYILCFFIFFALSSFICAKETDPETQKKEIKKQIIEIEKRIQDLIDKENKDKEIKQKQEIDQVEEHYQKLISAAGRKYQLLQPGVLGLDYSIQYTGKDYDQIQAAEESGTDIEKQSTHAIINKVRIEYPLKDNLAFIMTMPFVTIHDTVQGETIDLEDFGDPYMGVLYQPSILSQKLPPLIISAGISFPMGRSPYEINPQTEFPTGEGVYSINIGANLSKKIAPTLIYGGMFYSYKVRKSNLNFKNTIYLGETGEYLEAVKPGDEMGFNAGMGYVISENVSIKMGIKSSYVFPTKYEWRFRKELKSSSKFKSELQMGTAWQVTEKRKIYMDLDVGLTNNDQDFSFKLTIPFNFIL